MRMMHALALALALAAAPLVIAKADGDAIQKTIRSQIAAMALNDWDAAFAFASPTIQRLFRDPENFSRMVTEGYPMVWRPKRFQPGGLMQSDRGPVQLMLFEDQEGRVFIAEYLMQNVDGEWRINGVSIRPSEDQPV